MVVAVLDTMSIGSAGGGEFAVRVVVVEVKNAKPALVVTCLLPKSSFKLFFALSRDTLGRSDKNRSGLYVY